MYLNYGWCRSELCCFRYYLNLVCNNYVNSDVCEIFVNYDVTCDWLCWIMYDLGLYVGWIGILHDTRQNTRFIWAQVWWFDCLGGCYCTCALINWMLLLHGVSTYINCWPFFPSPLRLIIVTPSYSAPTLHPLSFIARVLRLWFFLGYVMMDWLLKELATDIASRIAEQSYAPMDDLASLRASCSFMRRVCGTTKVSKCIPLRWVLQRQGF